MTKTGTAYLHEMQTRFNFGVPQIDFHIHTKWTDGINNVKEMYDQACQLNLECILFSEHARATSDDWFPKFATEVRSLPNEPCIALVGAETRIVDYEGNVDISRDILSLCDLVVGSVHRFPGDNGSLLSFEKISPIEVLDLEFKLSKALLDNPSINIIGHPFGMSYFRFGKRPNKNKMFQLIKKAARKGIAFEVNSKYHPDPQELIQWCKKFGVNISLGSDAHSIDEIGKIVQRTKAGPYQ